MTPLPPQKTDDRKAPAKPGRAWSKPVLRRMTYVDGTQSGLDPIGPYEKPKYTPSS